MSNIPEYSVSELSNLIKRKLENDFSYIQIKGEISDLKLWNGHFLFNLKDNEGIIAARIWKNKVPFLNFKPEEGLEITATGKISTHIKRSSYNLLIDNIHATSEGELLKLIELRKKKLQKKGIFNKSRPLPLLPDRIAIVTSLTGAVIEDIKKKISTKLPSHLLIWPISVQGILAERDLINAIKGINALKKIHAPQVIILARGGGSVEDLMPFNSEKLAYELFNSKIPIISAVGHETDFSISDFAADHRASTPTAAADMVVPDKKELLQKIYNLSKNKEIFLNKIINTKFMSLKQSNLDIINPRKLMSIKTLKLEETIFHLIRLNKFKINKNEIRLSSLKVKSPIILFRRSKKSFESILSNADFSIERVIKNKRLYFKSRLDLLVSCSYQKWLKKGFAVIKNKKNKIIKNTNNLNVNDEIKINFLKGEIDAHVKKIKKT